MTKSGRWLQRAWGELVGSFGGQCWECGALHDLEFAHLKKTTVNGMGRSKWRRYYDILRHPTSYRLLCILCHDRMDGRSPRKKQREIVTR